MNRDLREIGNRELRSSKVRQFQSSESLLALLDGKWVKIPKIMEGKDHTRY